MSRTRGKGHREGRTQPNGCDGDRVGPMPVEPPSWKAVCYERSPHGLGRGSWKRAQVERVGKSQSVTTCEKRSSESIGEATRWLPTSFTSSLRACIDTFRARMLLKVCSVMYGSGLSRSTCSRRRPVAWQSSGQRSRISACTKSLCDAAEG
jgi:hypothetical protein